MSIQIKTESNYLLYANREKVAQLLSKPNLEEHEIINCYIALHLVLEIGIHGLFRNLFGLLGSMRSYSHSDFDENIDAIEFISKVRMFLSVLEFEFKDGQDVEVGKRYYSELPSKLMLFTNIRNVLLHGYSISTVSNGEVSKSSKTRRKLDSGRLKEQVVLFKEITDILTFFLRRLKSRIPTGQIDVFIETHLNTNFLPKSYGI